MVDHFVWILLKTIFFYTDAGYKSLSDRLNCGPQVVDIDLLILTCIVTSQIRTAHQSGRLTSLLRNLITMR